MNPLPKSQVNNPRGDKKEISGSEAHVSSNGTSLTSVFFAALGTTTTEDDEGATLLDWEMGEEDDEAIRSQPSTKSSSSSGTRDEFAASASPRAVRLGLGLA